MNPHDELDLLSSYLDEELEAADRARLDAHMTSCGECRGTLAGLRATIADLRTLPEPAPTAQDSWALRAAIRRARSPMRRWQRVSYAAGAVAAAAIAFAAITLPGGGGRDNLATSPEGAGGTTRAPIYQSGQNLSEADAQQRLLEAAGILSRTAVGSVEDPAESPPTENAFKDSVVLATPQFPTDSSLYASSDENDPLRAQIDRCVGVVRSSTQNFLEPIKYEVATFEDKPAFLLFFRSTERYELWVVGRSDCGVLFFSQAR